MVRKSGKNFKVRSGLEDFASVSKGNGKKGKGKGSDSQSPHSKKLTKKFQKKQLQSKPMIEFDLSKRNEFITGFRKRKDQRRRKARLEKEEEKIQQRKEIKKENKEHVVEEYKTVKKALKETEKFAEQQRLKRGGGGDLESDDKTSSEDNSLMKRMLKSEMKEELPSVGKDVEMEQKKSLLKEKESKDLLKKSDKKKSNGKNKSKTDSDESESDSESLSDESEEEKDDEDDSDSDSELVPNPTAVLSRVKTCGADGVTEKVDVYDSNKDESKSDSESDAFGGVSVKTTFGLPQDVMEQFQPVLSLTKSNLNDAKDNQIKDTNSKGKGKGKGGKGSIKGTKGKGKGMSEVNNGDDSTTVLSEQARKEAELKREKKLAAIKLEKKGKKKKSANAKKGDKKKKGKRTGIKERRRNAKKGKKK